MVISFEKNNSKSVIVHRRDAGFAEEKYVFFSAERAEKKKIYALVIGQNHSGANKSNYSKKYYVAVMPVFLFSFLSKGNKKK